VFRLSRAAAGSPDGNRYARTHAPTPAASVVAGSRASKSNARRAQAQASFETEHVPGPCRPQRRVHTTLGAPSSWCANAYACMRNNVRADSAKRGRCRGNFGFEESGGTQCR